MNEDNNRAVILMNLGSPDSTKVKDVRKYLSEFLMDERVIDTSYLIRLFLVKLIIAPFRAPKSAEAYRAIWTNSGSPLIVITKELRMALQRLVSIPVEICMRYGNPDPETAFERLLSNTKNLKEVLLIPMYPHFAMSSYETAVEYAKEIHHKKNYGFKLIVTPPFYKDSNYINALAESIRPYLQEEYDHFLFSYHGLPERHIFKGDITKSHCLKSIDCCETASKAHAYCYRHQCLETARLVIKKLGVPHEKFSYSFQSRLGRDEWLKPYTAECLNELPGKNVKKLIVACPAFVSDCLETLEEMAIRGKETFLEAGGESFTMIPCLNTQPLWVQTLASWILEKQTKLTHVH